MKNIASILLVDDSEADREYTKIILRRVGGFENVLEAQTGEEALKTFSEYAASGDGPLPTLVLLDINMPRMNGFEFLESLEAMRSQIEGRGATMPTVLMLSSSDNPEEKAQSRTFALVADYIVKPISKEVALRIRDEFGTSP